MMMRKLSTMTTNLKPSRLLRFLFVLLVTPPSLKILLHPNNNKSCLFLANAQQQDQAETTTDTPTNNLTPIATMLNNAKPLPLVGIGLGNLDPDVIPLTLQSSIGKKNLYYELVDTSKKSNNEALISKALSDLPDTDYETENFVITKVWYTHLGYERTKLSATESLAALSPNQRVTILIHHPRCDDKVSWMNCAAEEDELPASVKRAGPNPHFDKNAFLDSWRALEDLYMKEDRLMAIGVSNFSVEDMELLFHHCRIVPQVYQGHVGSLLFDDRLVRMLNDYNVLFQVYNVMVSIVKKMEELPNVRRYIGELATSFGIHDSEYSALVVAWLLQHRLGVVIRSADEAHLILNSPVAVRGIKKMEGSMVRDVADLIITAYRGEDVVENESGVVATFINTLSKPVRVLWKMGDDERVVSDELAAGFEAELKTHPGHSFVVEGAEDGQRLKTFKVKANYGEREYFRIEL